MTGLYGWMNFCIRQPISIEPQNKEIAKTKSPQQYPTTSTGWCILNKKTEKYIPIKELLPHYIDDANDANQIRDYIAGNYPTVFVYDAKKTDSSKSEYTVYIKSFDPNGVQMATMPITLHKQTPVRWVSDYIYTTYNVAGNYKDYSGNNYVCIRSVYKGSLSIFPKDP
jgi:hypothetical protein